MSAGSHRKPKNRPRNESSSGKKDFPKFGGIKVQALVVIAFLCATISVIALFSSSNVSESANFAERISKSTCEAESSTPQDDYVCLMSDCTFDTSVCSTLCPFGFQTDDSRCPSECACAESGVFEGDIMFDEDELPSMIEDYGFSVEEDFATYFGSAVATDNRLWKYDNKEGNYYIGYECGPNVPYPTKARLVEAMERIHKISCIRFEEVELSQYKKQGVLFRHDNEWCSIGVGRSVEGRNSEAYISPTCSLDKLKHQLMHLLGFHHEHARPDRDAYINVFPNNAYWQFRMFLVKMTERTVRNLNSEYDERSLLHYHEKTYSRNSQPTVLSKRGKELGSLDFSEEDIFELNALYGCDKLAKNPAPSPPKWTQWTSWSNCDVTCAVGKKLRYRKCHSKTGQDVTGCEGSGTDKSPCNAPSSCQSEWSEWSELRSCTRTCGSGWVVRSRRCKGTGCRGNSFDVTRCEIQSCKRDGMWSLWSDWQRCRATCGKASVVRIRMCKNSLNQISSNCGSGNRRVSREQQRRSCQLPTCESLLSWGPWSSCSATCEGNRKRKCTGKACPGEYQTEGCNTRSCTVADIFKKTRMKLNLDSVCNAAFNMDNWILGDFNGDSRMDMICLDQYKVYHLTYGSTSGFNSVWSGSFENCNADGIVLRGDINKDGKIDLICNSRDEGRLYVKYASDRSFTDGVTEGGDFCTDYLSRLSTVTYSKTTGLLCHYENNKVELIFTKN